MQKFIYRLLTVFIFACLSISIQAQDVIFTKDGQKYDCRILDQDSLKVQIKTFKLGATRTTYVPKELIDTLILGYQKNIISDARIFKEGGGTIYCYIESKDNKNYYYQGLDDGDNTWAFINIAKVDTVLYSQSSHFVNQRDEDSFISIGLGLDHGGIGIQVAGNLTKSINLFVGLGYALNGIGANVGTKIQIKSDDGQGRVVPFVEGMYGFNSVIVVANGSGFNKTFYGPSFGFGLDFYSRRGNFFSMGLIVPVRRAEVDNYIQNLKRNYGVVFSNDLSPITLSLGYGFPIK